MKTGLRQHMVGEFMIRASSGRDISQSLEPLTLFPKCRSTQSPGCMPYALKPAINVRTSWRNWVPVNEREGSSASMKSG
jgi:hypothetical protein